MTPTLPALIESILLFRGGAVTYKELGKITAASDEDVHAAVEELERTLVGRGTRLVRHAERVALTTAPESRTAIEAMRRDELDGDLGRAGLETLAVVIFQGQVTRADIEYIRGVNVSTTLRSLLIRGLVERIDNPKDKRSFLYKPTVDVAAYFGVAKISDIPHYDTIRASLSAVVEARPVDIDHV